MQEGGFGWGGGCERGGGGHALGGGGGVEKGAGADMARSGATSAKVSNVISFLGGGDASRAQPPRAVRRIGAYGCVGVLACGASGSACVDARLHIIYIDIYIYIDR